MSNLPEIKEKIKQFILENTYVAPDQVQNDTLIFAQGIFDSMGFISLISFLEQTFNVKAKDSELLEDNFESIDAMANFVLRKLNPE
ncbi:MAG TPA: acyl carrier protein [Bacteroidales bacterium]|jgi:acyl carrier protein|nr:acyl carrier protein [Bacteroidales bacterium]